ELFHVARTRKAIQEALHRVILKQFLKGSLLRVGLIQQTGARMHRGRVWSKHGLQIRPHHSFNPTDPRVFHELVHGEFSDSLTIGSQRLNSNINSDFVAVLEAVSDRFFGRVYFDRHPIDVNRLDSGFKGARWEPEDSDGHTVHLGYLGVALKRN